MNQLFDFYKPLIEVFTIAQASMFSYRELKKKEEDDDQQLGAYLNKHSSR